jgi:hypothetical protein
MPKARETTWVGLKIWVSSAREGKRHERKTPKEYHKIQK